MCPRWKRPWPKTPPGAFTMPGQGVLGPVAGRTAVLEFICDGHTAQTGRVRHHLGNVVVTTTDAATAEDRACPTDHGQKPGKYVQVTGRYSGCAPWMTMTVSVHVDR
ncbi:hypothetical protein ACE1SV_76490 [Streptomyces sennicomposti]